MWILLGLVTRLRTREDSATGKVGQENVAETALHDPMHLDVTSYLPNKHKLGCSSVGVVLAGCLNPAKYGGLQYHVDSGGWITCIKGRKHDDSRPSRSG